MSETTKTQTETQSESHDLIRFMDRVHAEEIYETPEIALQNLREMDYSTFESMLVRINGIVRDTDVHERGFDGGGFIKTENALTRSATIDYVPPLPEHRQDLLEEAFAVAKTVDYPDEAATLLGLSINAIHPFNDGNGRTSRFVYTLLSRGYDGSDEAREYYESVLRNVEGRQVLDINPEKFSLEWKLKRKVVSKLAKEQNIDVTPSRLHGGFETNDFESQSPLNLICNKSVSRDQRAKLFMVLNGGVSGVEAFMNFFAQQEIATKDYANEYGAISVSETVPSLSNDDIETIFNLFGTAKKEFVQELIHVFDDKDTRGKLKLVDTFRPQRVE